MAIMYDFCSCQYSHRGTVLDSECVCVCVRVCVRVCTCGLQTLPLQSSAQAKGNEIALCEMNKVLLNRIELKKQYLI